MRRDVVIRATADGSEIQRVGTSHRANEPSVQKQLLPKQETDTEEAQHVRSHVTEVIVEFVACEASGCSSASTTTTTEHTKSATIRTGAI